MKKKINILYIILTIILCFTINPNRINAAMTCKYENQDNTNGKKYLITLTQHDDGTIKAEGRYVNYQIRKEDMDYVSPKKIEFSPSKYIEPKEIPSDLSDNDNHWDDRVTQKDVSGRKCTRYSRRYTDYKKVNGVKIYNHCPRYVNVEDFNDKIQDKLVFYSLQFAITDCKNSDNNKLDDNSGKGSGKQYYEEFHKNTNQNICKIAILTEEKTNVSEKKIEEEKKEELAEAGVNSECPYYKNKSSTTQTNVVVEKFDNSEPYIQIKDYIDYMYTNQLTDNDSTAPFKIDKELINKFSNGCVEKFYLNKKENIYKLNDDDDSHDEYTLDKKEVVEITEEEKKSYTKREIKIKNKNIDNCKDLIGDDGIDLINEIMNVIKIVVPILLLVFGIIDFLKATFAGSEDDMSKAKKDFMKRLIAAVVVFLTPILINFLLEVANNVWGNIHAADCVK